MPPVYLTREECEVVAKNLNKNYTLLSYSLEPFYKEIRGYLGTHIRLKLQVTEGTVTKSLSCFVKTVDGGNLSKCLEDAQIFEKEVFIYKFLEEVKALIPEVRADVIPKIYYWSTETQTVVLENLCELGFQGNDGLKFDEEHMLVLLEALAKFHSISFAYEERKSELLGREYRIDEDYADVLKPTFSVDAKKCGHRYVWSSVAGAESLIDLVVADGEERVSLKDKVRKSGWLLIDAVNGDKGMKFRNVVSHGDLWGFNGLFRHDAEGIPVESKLVDFQLSRYTPPAHDLNMVVFMASTRKLFKKNVQKYYKHYYECLTKELKRLDIDVGRVLPVQEFEASCKVFLKVAKFIWLCYRQTSQSTEENFAKVSKDEKTLFSVVLGEGRAWYVKRNYLEDEIYRKALTEILEDYRLSVKSDLVAPEECFELIRRKLGDVEYDFIGHDVVAASDGKHELVVRIRRENVENIEEYKFKMDATKNILDY